MAAGILCCGVDEAQEWLTGLEAPQDQQREENDNENRYDHEHEVPR